MRVADVCTRRVICATPSMHLVDAADLMQKNQVGALVVVDSPGRDARPVAMLTDRDIALALAVADRSPAHRTVSDVMSAGVVVCTENDVLFDVIEMMRSRGVRRMPVVDVAGRLTAVLSADDLVGALAEHLVSIARVLTYSQSTPDRGADAARGIDRSAGEAET